MDATRMKALRNSTCIVGVDESDPSKGKISWISPVAKALISAKVGDVVTLEVPEGHVELEILEIEYR